jgi:hypothetical protein
MEERRTTSYEEEERGHLNFLTPRDLVRNMITQFYEQQCRKLVYPHFRVLAVPTGLTKTISMFLIGFTFIDDGFFVVNEQLSLKTEIQHQIIPCRGVYAEFTLNCY